MQIVRMNRTHAAKVAQLGMSAGGDLKKNRKFVKKINENNELIYMRECVRALSCPFN